VTRPDEIKTRDDVPPKQESIQADDVTNDPFVESITLVNKLLPTFASPSEKKPGDKSKSVIRSLAWLFKSPDVTDSRERKKATAVNNSVSLKIERNVLRDPREDRAGTSPTVRPKYRRREQPATPAHLHKTAPEAPPPPSSTTKPVPTDGGRHRALAQSGFDM